MNRERVRRAAILEQVDLYPVTSARHSAGRPTEAIVEAVLAAGCRIFQLREKDLTKRALFVLAARVRRLTPPEVLFFVNDHLDVALAVGADGVHLGQDDLPVQAARDLAPDLLLGASAHNLAEALAAQAAGADYVNIGPIFPTRTKEGVSTFLGPEAIGGFIPALRVPFTVMGGIGLDNIDQVLAQGARRIAVVTAVTAAADPRAAARALRERIRAAGLPGGRSGTRTGIETP